MAELTNTHTQSWSAHGLTWYWTVSCMAPRWTGMWGALDTRPPSGPNTAHEKSSRSFMFVEMEVLWRTLPICSKGEDRHSKQEVDTSSSFPSSLTCWHTCYAHEAVGEDGELHSVELSAQSAVRVGAHGHANVAPFCQTSLTAWFHQDGADGGGGRKTSINYNTCTDV